VTDRVGQHLQSALADEHVAAIVVEVVASSNRC
jgi:hypothetical protein